MELNYRNIVSEKLVNILMNLSSLKSLDKEFFYNFSVYKNGVPGSGKTESRNLIPVKELTYHKVQELLDNVPVGYELAINSLITADKKNYQLAFIDFSYRFYDNVFLEAIKTLKINYPQDIYILKSGRSFHGYQDILFGEEEWKEYLGKLLLLNKPYDSFEIIDSRWVGHSLIQGFSALRLSHFTSSYLKYPELIEKL